MKTTTTLLLIVTLNAASLLGVFYSHTNRPATKHQTPAGNSLTSFPRSFMPYSEDPCNHLPARETFC